MQHHPRRSDTEKQSLVTAWEQSTKKMTMFCQENNISVSSLKSWQSKFGKRKKQKISSNNFVALEVAAPSAETTFSPYAELHFDNGAKLLLHHPVSSAFLRELLY